MGHSAHHDCRGRTLHRSPYTAYRNDSTHLWNHNCLELPSPIQWFMLRNPARSLYWLSHERILSKCLWFYRRVSQYFQRNYCWFCHPNFSKALITSIVYLSALWTMELSSLSLRAPSSTSYTWQCPVLPADCQVPTRRAIWPIDSSTIYLSRFFPFLVGSYPGFVCSTSRHWQGSGANRNEIGWLDDAPPKFQWISEMDSGSYAQTCMDFVIFPFDLCLVNSLSVISPLDCWILLLIFVRQIWY